MSSVDEHLDFGTITECLAVGGGRALGALNMKFKLVKNMGVDTYTKLFENCVIPVLHYGAGVWGLQAHKRLQNVQNRAMRFYLGTHKLTPTLGMSGDLGWYSLELFRIQDAIRLWNRFIKMSNDRITKKIFMWDWKQCSRNWSSEIRTIFYNADMGEYFDEMHLCSIDDISEILKSDFEQQWSEKIKDKVKLEHTMI